MSDPSNSRLESAADQFVRSRRSLAGKLLAGGAAGFVFGFALIGEFAGPPGRKKTIVIGSVLLASTVLGVLAGLALSRYDAYRDSLANPNSPHPGMLTTIFFGGGLASLLFVWVPLIFVIAMAAIIGGSILSIR